jgi:hypothetical protein
VIGLVCTKPNGLCSKFVRFHEDNPQVFDKLRELALDLVARGHEKLSGRMIWEVMRWQHAVSVTDPSSLYRYNDHYLPYYVRLLDLEPALTGRFELRRQDDPLVLA